MTSDVVFIGADSRIHDRLGTPERDACKIITVGNVVFANAGIQEDPAGNLNIRTMALAALRRAGPLEKRTKDFESTVKVALTQYFEARSSRATEADKAYFQRGAVVQTAFVTNVAGLPTVYSSYFILKWTAPSSVVVEVKRESCPGDCTHLFLGYFDEIRNYNQLAEFRNKTLGAVALTNRLIEIEAEAHPAEVGGKVAILRLDRNGPRWIQRGECQE